MKILEFLENFHILKKLQSIPDFAVCFQEGAPVPAMAAQAAPAAAPTPVAAAFVGASVPWQEFPVRVASSFPKFQEMSGNVASFAKLKSLKHLEAEAEAVQQFHLQDLEL